MAQLLGYQLRVLPTEISRLWPKERRDAYLLRPEIEAPLSADPSVWPCADCPELSRKIFVDYSSEPFEAPNGLSLYPLRAGAMQALREARTPAVLVGLAAGDRDAERLRAKHFIQLPSAGSIHQEGFLELRGIDVCDEWLKSGLMNCGLQPADQEQLRREFRERVNSVGLLSSELTALDLAEKLRRLVPEHAPFMPFHIYVAHAI